jgi:hypothetical protein
MVRWAKKVAELEPFIGKFRLNNRVVGQPNPAFLKWFEKNLIPPPDTPLCGETAKKLYHLEFRSLVRAHAEAYLYMLERGSFDNFSLADYGRQIHIEHTRYAADCKSFAVGTASNWVAAPYRKAETCRFWFRRTADGSRQQLVGMMKRLLPKFDPPYWKAARARFAKRAPKLPSTDSLCSGLRCKKYGKCSYDTQHTNARRVRCIATKTADCRRSEVCRTKKRCHALNQRCSKSATCRATASCRYLGRCTRERKTGRCVVRGSKDCRSSNTCKKYGSCTFSDGRCIAAKQQDCATSARCKEYGRCTLIGSQCTAGSDSDCQQSKVCRDTNRCKVKDGTCVAPKRREKCGHTKFACRYSGRCAQEGSRCVAVSASDCRKSVGCKYGGRCGLNAVTKRCKADSDADCRNSKFCPMKGRCALDAAKSRCHAVSATDCRKSRDCKGEGACVAKNGRCKPDSDQDCKASKACPRSGLCHYSPVRSSCVARSDQDCSAITDCKKHGKCHEKNGKCRAGSQADCEQSNGCKKYGRCKFRSGSCVKGQSSRPRPPSST